MSSVSRSCFCSINKAKEEAGYVNIVNSAGMSEKEQDCY